MHTQEQGRRWVRQSERLSSDTHTQTHTHTNTERERERERKRERERLYEERV